MSNIWLPDETNLLLRVSGRVLRQAGHKILQCSGSEFRTGRPKSVRSEKNLLIFDLEQESEKARATTVVLKVRIPTLRALLLSDGAHSETEKNEKSILTMFSTGERMVLQKPFTRQELVERVAEALRAQPRAAAGQAGSGA